MPTTSTDQESKPTPPASDRAADPCVMVIFGASGDLTKRKLVPAIANLAQSHLLSDHFAAVGVGRDPMEAAQFRERLMKELEEFASCPLEPDVRAWVAERLFYVSGNYKAPSTYERIGQELARLTTQFETGGHALFYLATPPDLFPEIAVRLGEAGLTHEERGAWRRVIFEKPFGHDLESARALNQVIASVLAERQVYRIDHYLGKETVQNIMAFRFANGIFEPIWNRRYIDHVQITVAETVGVEMRGAYYEGAGALRDMIQNHLFQILALTAMEPPISFEANAVRDERVKVLHAIRPFTPEEVLRQTVRGQYGEAIVDGERLPAYRSEPNVAPHSPTETYAAMKLYLDNWRWADVPFYLRTGKRLPKRVSEVAVQFKQAPFIMFRDTPVDHLQPNLLLLRIQPDEGIALRFQAKEPGPNVKLGTVKMDFSYADYFGASPNTGYETLLYDCMTGDSTLFHRADMVDAGWTVVTPILDVWKAVPPRGFPNYPAFSAGPPEADDLIERDGRRWRKI